MAQITVTDKFWQYYRDLIKNEMIPYQWKVLSDEIDVNIERERNDDSIPNEKSHAIENFKIAAGLAEGNHYGWVFQDSDVYKWLEAVAYTLQNCTDEKLKELADSVVDLIAAAQEDDGYLSTASTSSLRKVMSFTVQAISWRLRRPIMQLPVIRRLSMLPVSLRTA